MEFAVVRTGGKQYSVSVGDKLFVEKLSDVVAGEKVTLNDVLLYSKDDKVVIGDDLKNVKVEASVVEQIRARKIIVFKKERRQNHRRKNGFRRHLTVLKIENIIAA